MVDATLITDQSLSSRWLTNLRYKHKEKRNLNMITLTTNCSPIEMNSEDNIAVKKVAHSPSGTRRRAMTTCDDDSHYLNYVPVTSYTVTEGSINATTKPSKDTYDSEECSGQDESDDESYGIIEDNTTRKRATSEIASMLPKWFCTDDEGALDTNEIVWEIADFDLNQAIYESNAFDFNDQCWNFSFGHNNADGYGFILCLQKPQVVKLQLQCSFGIHNRDGASYEKTREEPYIFGINSMKSRGFVNFATTEVIKQHIQENGTLKLSVNLTVVEVDCSDDASTQLSEDLRESIGYVKQRSSLFIGCVSAAFDNNENLPSLTHDDKLCSPIMRAKEPLSPRSFKPYVACNGLYIKSPFGHDHKSEGEFTVPAKSPLGLVAPPYVSVPGKTTPDATDNYECLICSWCDKSADADHRYCSSRSDSAFDNFVDSDTNESLHDDSTTIEEDERRTLLQSNRDNSTENDETLLNNRNTSFKGDDSENDEADDGMTSDGSDKSPLQANDNPLIVNGVTIDCYTMPSVLTTPTSMIAHDDSSNDSDDKEKQYKIPRKAILPRKTGKHHNLLADSLHLLSERIHVECTSEPRNVNLSIPLQKHPARNRNDFNYIRNSNEATSNSCFRNESNRRQQQNYHLNSKLPLLPDLNAVRQPFMEVGPTTPTTYSISKESYCFSSINITDDQKVVQSELLTVDTDKGFGFRPALSSVKKSTRFSSNTQEFSPMKYTHFEPKCRSKNSKSTRVSMRSQRLTKKAGVKSKDKPNETAAKVIHQYTNATSILIALFGILLNQFSQKELFIAATWFIFRLINMIMKIIILGIAFIVVVMVH